MGKLVVVKLADIAEVRAGQSPPGPTISEAKSGVPFFQGAKDFGPRYPRVRTYTTAPARLAQPGDILLSVRAPIGRVNRSQTECAIGRGLVALRGLFGKVCTDYLEYWLRFYEPRWHQHESAGSVFANLSTADLRRLEIPLPPLSEQRAIAEVLGALDDKIEANRRVAEYSRRLAIAEGIDCLSRFPGRLVALEQVATTVKGVSYRSEDLVPGGGWLVSLKCVGRDGSFRANGLKPFSGVAKVSQFVEEGDILVAQTDLTQRAEVIGRPIRIAKLGLIGHLVASLDFVIVRPESGLTNETLFAILSQQEFRDHALGYCNGTTVLHMNSRGVPSFEFALPPPEGIAQITSVMRPLLKRSDTAQRESQLLEQLRDTLLPKLLSGELRVRDAEPLVEEVV